MAGTLVIDTLKASTGVLATQNGMTGICKAWVAFNGNGTNTIRGSFNVSSITRLAAGKYTVTYTTAMPNANYAVNATGSSNSGYNMDGFSLGCVMMNYTTPYVSTTSVNVGFSVVANGGGYDYASDYASVSIFA